MASKKKAPPTSELCGNDEGLKTVCGWLSVDVDKYRATDRDYEVDGTLRPNRGGVGSENLSKKAIKAQTSGQLAFGGLERKLVPKALQREVAKKRAREESDEDDGIEKGGKGVTGAATLDIRSELEQHAAQQKTKQRKRRKKAGGKSPAAQPLAPNKPMVAMGADD